MTMFGLSLCLYMTILVCLRCDVRGDVGYSLLSRRLEYLELETVSIAERIDQIEMLIKSQLPTNAQVIEVSEVRNEKVELEHMSQAKETILNAFASEKLFLRTALREYEEQFTELRKTVNDQMNLMTKSVEESNESSERKTEETVANMNSSMNQFKLNLDIVLHDVIIEFETAMNNTAIERETTISNVDDVRNSVKKIENDLSDQSSRISAVESRLSSPYSNQSSRISAVENRLSSLYSSVVNGGWTVWSSWSNCSAYCMSERTRTCSNPVPSTFGKNCLGNSKEKKGCNQEYCSHSIRLVNGSDPYEGRLEVFYNGQWGTVCDDRFTDNTADVVCRMLNYDGIPRQYQSAAYGQGTLPILLDDVICTGSEENIFDCRHLSWGTHDCSHKEDVSVSCHSSVNVRLVNGTSSNNGRIEVSRGDNSWGTVCDTGFVKNDAEDFCRRLGLPTNITIIYGAGYYGYGSGPSLVTDVSCSSSESNFPKCGYFAKTNSSCDHTRSVGIACLNDDISVRLVNGTNQHNGRVEVSIDDGSNWGPVCDSSFNKHDATVICRTLGYSTNLTIPYNSARFGPGTTQNTLSDLGCSGSENSLADCNFGMVSTACSHKYDVGVSCNTNVNFRLVNGTNQHVGRVEVSLDGGSWGPICDSSLDVHDATVICRMLGYPTNMVITYGGAYYGQGTQPYILGGLGCNGNERNISDCNMYSNWRCGENRASGVWCSKNNSNFHARLVNGSDAHNGRLEVSYDGSTWGTVCDSGISQNQAKVVCRMLGFPTNFTMVYKEAYFGRGTLHNILSAISCAGSEQSLNDCTVGLQTSCGQSHGVGIGCTAYTGLRLRLLDGSSVHSGRLEVSVDGSNWGTVCDDDFDAAAARVACKMLGFPWSNATTMDPADGRGPLLLDDVVCTGSESTLADCRHRTWGTHNCGHHEDIGVTCA